MSKLSKKKADRLRGRIAMAARIFWVACVVWFAATSTFICIEGWHWQATHPVEGALDLVAALLFCTAAYVWGRAINDATVAYLKKKDEP